MNKDSHTGNGFSAEIANEFPAGGRDGYWIRILFHGLLAGWIENVDGKGELHVGALNGVEEHNISLSLCPKGGRLCYIPLEGVSNISLTLTDDTQPTVEILQLSKISEDEFDRDRSQYYDQEFRHDFRWLLDFGKIHRSEMNRQPLIKNSERLSPRFKLNAGLIYTLVRSIPLRLCRGGLITPFGRSAQIFAVNIYKTANADAQWKVGDQAPVTLVRDVTYDIVLRNDCHCTGSVKPGDRVDTSELNAAFQEPRLGYFDIQSAIDAQSTNERSWWKKEHEGIDFGEDLGRDYPLRDTRIDPCGEVFLG